MIIGIDGNEANTKKRVGIGEYAFELLRELSKSKIKNQKSKFVVYLKDKPISDLPEANEDWTYRVLKPGKIWTQWRLPMDLYLHSPRPDVFFSPSHYAPRFSPVPTVVSVMDLSYVYFPTLFAKQDLYQLRNWTAYSVKKAKKILTISNSSKNDIIKEYAVASGKVTVTYPGVKKIQKLTPNIYVMKQVKTKYNISDNYVLFVGTLQPRKNIVRLIEAFSITLKDPDLNADLRRRLQLVIVGKRGWLYEDILEAPKKLGVENSVKFLEDVDNEELTTLYKHAICFVLPSLYEGFGLPVLEAMQEGCPVITSNVSSLPEAGGDACLYVDPENTADIVDKISKLINNDDLRKSLIEKGKKQAQKFSWEKSARETLKILEDVGRKT